MSAPWPFLAQLSHVDTFLRSFSLSEGVHRIGASSNSQPARSWACWPHAMWLEEIPRHVPRNVCFHGLSKLQVIQLDRNQTRLNSTPTSNALCFDIASATEQGSRRWANDTRNKVRIGVLNRNNGWQAPRIDLRTKFA
jgi:hypothetical protein